MVIHLNETFPKDINGNYINDTLPIKSSSLNQCKKFYHFNEISPSKVTINCNEPSKGVTSVLLGPPSDQSVINYSNGTENDFTETLIISEDCPSSKLHQHHHQINHVNQSDKIIGHTVSVSTCTSCGSESKPSIDYHHQPVIDSNTYSSQSLTELKGKNGKSSTRSTPINGYHANSSSISARSMNSLSSSSYLPPPPRSKKRTLKLKGCHICDHFPPTSLTPPRKKIPDNCPYSIVLGSFHPTIKANNLNYRPGNGYNQSTGSKEATRRALIMIFTITSILLFLMVTYYGAIIYLRMRVQNQNHYND